MPLEYIRDIDNYLHSKDSNKNRPQPKENIEPIEIHSNNKKDITESKFVDVDKKEDRNWLGEGLRLGVGALASGASGLAGVPGNIVSAINYITGLTKPQDVQDFLNDRQKMADLEKNPELARFIKGGAIPDLPHSKDIKQKIGKVLPEGYFDETSEGQRILNEIAEDAGSFLFPLGGSTSIKKASGISGISNLLKYGAKSLGFDESTQDKVKIGSAILASLYTQPKLKELGRREYEKLSEELAEKTINVPSKSIREVMDKGSKFSDRGIKSVGGKKVMNDILHSLDEMSHGKSVPVADILAAKQDIGELISEVGKKHRRLVPHLVDMQKDLSSILRSSKEIPKEISDRIIKAESLWSGVHSADNISQFINKIGNKLSGLSTVSALVNPAALKGLAAGVATTATSPLTSGTLGILKNIAVNPIARNEYIKMMGAAVKESTPLFLKHAKKLEGELKPMTFQNKHNLPSRFQYIKLD